MGVHLPGRRAACLENDDLGVFGRKEVIIAWFTADAASGVG